MADGYRAVGVPVMVERAAVGDVVERNVLACPDELRQAERRGLECGFAAAGNQERSLA